MGMSEQFQLNIRRFGGSLYRVCKLAFDEKQAILPVAVHP